MLSLVFFWQKEKKELWKGEVEMLSLAFFWKKYGKCNEKIIVKRKSRNVISGSFSEKCENVTKKELWKGKVEMLSLVFSDKKKK